MDDLADQLLAGVVAWVRLAGEDDLHGHGRLVEQRMEAVVVLEQQVGALVGGEPPGEPDGQRLGVEHFLRRRQLARTGPAAHQLVAQAAAGEGHQPFAAPLVGAPQLGVGDLVGALPDADIGRLLLPIRAQVPVVQLGKVVADPTAGVDAVGGVTDGHFVGRQGRPDARPQPPADLAVQLGDAVARAAQPKGEHGQAQRLVVVVRVLAAEGEELLPGQAQPGPIVLEVLVDQPGLEGVVAGRDGGVGGEHVRRRHRLAGRLEGDAPLLHQNADALEAEEGGVALVHVEHVGLDAQELQGPHPAYAEENLLADPHFLVAAVELAGDLAILGRVLRHVGVQQVQGDPAHADVPDLGLDVPPGELHLHHGRRVVAEHLGDGEIVEVVPREQLELPSVGVEALAEVALLVQQSHPHQRDAQLGGALEVVARQHAQAARVDRQRLGQAELGAEIRDPRAVGGAVVVRPPRAAGEVVLQLVVGAAELGHEPGVPTARIEPLLADLPEHGDGVVTGAFPQVGVEAAEHIADLPAPGPAEVHGQLNQTGQVLRQRRFDLESS